MADTDDDMEYVDSIDILQSMKMREIEREAQYRADYEKETQKRLIMLARMVITAQRAREDWMNVRTTDRLVTMKQREKELMRECRVVLAGPETNLDHVHHE